MKILSPFIVALALTACAQDRGDVRSYGNDAPPSAEVIAFQQTHQRLNYTGARIEYDADGCARYQGVAPDGQTQSEPLRDAANRPICVRK